MVQPVQLCNPATAVGGQGDGGCSEVSVGGIIENARGGSRPGLAQRQVDLYTNDASRGRAVAARRAHNPEVVGSNPTPATIVSTVVRAA